MTILLWWLVLEGLGLAALPLAVSLCKTLSDRGYPLAKALGLLVAGYFFWLLGTLGVLENTREAILLVILALAVGSWLPNRDWRRRGLAVLRDQWRLILATEVLFAVAFLALVGLRACNPEIAGSEKPMDFAFLNSILRSRHLPPLDPWMSGYTMRYYYFGYLLMAMLTRLTGTLPSIAFNLSIAVVFALTVSGACSLVYNLVAGRGARPATAFPFGLLGALFVAVLGNLEGFLELVYAQGWGAPAFWRWLHVARLFPPHVRPTGGLPAGDWWWRASRVIPGAIGEFPFFSFLLADLHAHVMALPFGLLVLGLGLAVLRAPAADAKACSTSARPFDWRRLWPVGLLPGVPLLVGALGFLNGWDLISYGLVVIAAYAIWAYTQTDWRGWRWVLRVAHYAGVLVVLGIVFYLPFYVSSGIQPRGIAPVLGQYTSLTRLLIFFGPFLLPAMALVLDGWRRTRVAGPANVFGVVLAVVLPVILLLAWRIAILVGIVSGSMPADEWSAATSSPAKLTHLLLYAFLAAGALWAALRVVQRPQGETGSLVSDRFALILIALAAVLLLVCETFYIRDVSDSRMNTVFKFYYQAWVLLAVAASYGLYVVFRRWPRRAGLAVNVIAGMLILAALCYPLLAVPSKASDFRGQPRGQPTLDGMDWLAGTYPGELEAVRWLNEHVEGTPVILEAVVGGGWGDYGRISGMTGLPTVLGWGEHEWQWRGEYPDQREKDAIAIYKGSAETARALLARYDVTYVYVGALERQDYSPEALAKFGAFMDVVYDAGGVTIYKWQQVGRLSQGG